MNKTPSTDRWAQPNDGGHHWLTALRTTNGPKPTKPNLPNQTFQTKPTKPDLPNLTYQTKPTKPNLPNQSYQTKPNIQTKPTKSNLLNKTYQTNPNHASQSNKNKELIRAREALTCPELGTTQPQLVSILCVFCYHFMNNLYWHWYKGPLKING